MLQKLKPYWQALPVIFNYQIITKALIGIWIYLLGRITQALLCPRGVIVALYIALIAPLLGFGVSVSLTEGLYVPTFIASVIADTPLVS